MKQSELNLAVASATGESVNTIASRGFTLMMPSPSTELEEIRDPLVVDWDDVDAQRRAA
jgi:hypothetical protein